MHFRGWVNMQDTSPSNHKSPSLPRVRDHSLFPGRDPSRSSYVAHAKGFYQLDNTLLAQWRLCAIP
jgi:hypothetical protein